MASLCVRWGWGGARKYMTPGPCQAAVSLAADLWVPRLGSPCPPSPATILRASLEKLGFDTLSGPSGTFVTHWVMLSHHPPWPPAVSLAAFVSLPRICLTPLGVSTVYSLSGHIGA